MDVNDWIEASLGWLPAKPVLESLVLPRLRYDSKVLELGVGTGRWSRHIAPRIPGGKLVLVDKSAWVVGFLRNYFRDLAHVTALHGNGVQLPTRNDGWADVCFSQGLFITLKLGHVYLYLREFSRTLKKGGRAVFDFIDPEAPAGWDFLSREVARSHEVFAYHSHAAIGKCCEAAALQIEATHVAGKSTYVVARKL